jgi:D-3-phosphoglycerate dehydrogenase / 2-oxoglutarate reductase
MITPVRVLLADSVHPILIDLFKDAGFTTQYFKDIDYSEFIRIIPDYEGLIIRGRFILNQDFFNQATRLKFVGRVGSGMENIDYPYALKRGVICFNSPEGNRDAVADHAMGMLLGLMNRLFIVNREVREGIWLREENRGIELAGKTVGIIGYGHMGSAFSERLSGFGVKVLAYDKYKSGFGNSWVSESSLDDIFLESDIISFHVPLTSETEYMFNREFINKCRKAFFLINTSRGKVVNTEHLLDGLKERKVIGAALDVLEYEDHSFEHFFNKPLPIVFSELCKRDDVVLSPHIAGWTIESNYKLAEVLACKILNWYNNGCVLPSEKLIQNSRQTL